MIVPRWLQRLGWGVWERLASASLPRRTVADRHPGPLSVSSAMRRAAECVGTRCIAGLESMTRSASRAMPDKLS